MKHKEVCVFCITYHKAEIPQYKAEITYHKSRNNLTLLRGGLLWSGVFGGDSARPSFIP